MLSTEFKVQTTNVNAEKPIKFKCQKSIVFTLT